LELDKKYYPPVRYAEFIKEQWGLGERPIVDILTLLEEHGFVISNVKNDSDKFDDFSSYIEINNNSYFITLD